MTGLDIDRMDYETDGFRIADLDPDPLVTVRAWLDLAVDMDHPQPDTMALATVDATGTPAVRSVLLKGLDTGLVFFTSYHSDKAIHLEATGVAACNLPWVLIHRQVRARGKVERTTAAESDAYWASRPRGAQLAAAASDQSRPMAERHVLEKAIADLDVRHRDTSVPRPDDWGGYRIIPQAVELWQGRRNRMHDRALFTRNGDAWQVTRLAP